MTFKLLAIICVTPVAFSFQAASYSGFFSPERVSADINWGALSGKTKERIYDSEEGGRKVSLRDWKYSNTTVLKGAAIPWLSVGVGGWASLNNWEGNMIDQDWMDSRFSGKWTDESRHPNTRPNYANEFELNIQERLLNEPDYWLDFIVVYPESRYSFNVR